MKTIIAGSRSITQEQVNKAIEGYILTGRFITEVVSGTCSGADVCGEQWAKKHLIPVKRFPADWNKYGRRAGHIRNQEMADYADALVAVWDGKSRGTKSMIEKAVAGGLVVYVYVV